MKLNSFDEPSFSPLFPVEASKYGGEPGSEFDGLEIGEQGPR